MAEKIRDDISQLLNRVYPGADLPTLTDAVIQAFWPTGLPDTQPAQNAAQPLWSQNDAVLITYGNTIQDGQHKPLDVLHDFLLEHVRGVINSVHILPFFPYTSDDGFAVTDFRKVDPGLGDWSDIERIGKDFTLMSDLVLNHVSSRGIWFTEFRQGNTPFDGYFFTASPDNDLSKVVRPRTTPLLREVETVSGLQHVWCTFSHDQIDLDYSNPNVLLEMLRIMRLHIDKGVRILRLDAVAFLWKEIGTPSIHMPQTHAIIQLFRVLVNFAPEPVILLTETNVPKAENLSYFGQSNEAHAIYNFPLPPLILHAMLSGSARHLRSWQSGMPPAPPTCTYLNFTASHDGIGMRPVEGLLPEEEINKMIDAVLAAGGLISKRALPDGGESVYEINCGYFPAMVRTFRGEDNWQFERFLASQTIVMALEGIPAFYIHSLLATENDRESVETRGLNRAINRHRWDYQKLRTALDDPQSNHARVLNALSQRLALRSLQPAFHPNATQFTLPLDERVFGVWRQSQDRRQSIFALHNVSSSMVELPLSSLNLIADETWIDLLNEETLPLEAEQIQLLPYQCRWITNLDVTGETKL
ncbi:MAG: sugar phosphorylase [Granulosicoccus sp.]|nr:sugar phosphorylase [Granulosicoccus sp.]